MGAQVLKTSQPGMGRRVIKGVRDMPGSARVVPGNGSAVILQAGDTFEKDGLTRSVYTGDDMQSCLKGNRKSRNHCVLSVRLVVVLLF